jgi:RNA polymerase sigma factor (sigma-70 family)
MSTSAWPNPTTDDILIEACLEGQEAAWEALISKYERLIYAICRRNNIIATEAEDIFGRVCMLLLQHLETLKDRTRLAAWLITTTNRECWHYKNHLAGATSLSYPMQGDKGFFRFESELAAQALLPEDEVLRLEMYQNLRESLLQLSPQCQKLLWHLFYDPTEPSYSQISDQLGLPVSSIGPNRARCLNKLRSLFQKSNQQ